MIRKNKRTMKKPLLIIWALIVSLSSQAQESELFRTWYLTEVIVDNTSYLPSDYEFYPTVRFEENGNPHGLQIDVPTTLNASSVSPVNDFAVDPSSFILAQDWVTLPTELCNEDPTTGGPCTFIHDKHEEVYYKPPSSPILMSYLFTSEGNGLYTLEITNSTTQDSAFYSSELLTLNEFMESSVSISPNPVKNNLVIRNSNAVEIRNLTV